MNKVKKNMIYIGVLIFVILIAVGIYKYQEWQWNKVLDTYRAQNTEMIVYSKTLVGDTARLTTEKEVLQNTNKNMREQIKKKNKELEYYVNMTGILEAQNYNGEAYFIDESVIQNLTVYNYEINDEKYFGKIAITSILQPNKVDYDFTIKEQELELDFVTIWDKKRKTYEVLIESKTPGFYITQLDASRVVPKPKIWDDLHIGIAAGYYQGPVISGYLGASIWRVNGIIGYNTVPKYGIVLGIGN